MSESEAPPPPPNYQPIAEASKYQAELENKLAQDQLAWAKQVYAENKPLTDEIVHSFIDTQNQNLENARKDRARYESTFQPLEDELIDDYHNYNSERRRDYEAGKAQAAVAQQYDAQRQNATRDLEAYGINPSATRFAALDIGVRANQAATEVAAADAARTRVENTARGLREQAINIGRGYPAQSLGSYGVGNQSGAGGINGMNTSFQTGSNAMTAPSAYTGQANNAIGTWGNIVNQGYQNQLAYYNAQQNQSSGWGSALGFAAGLARPFIFASRGGAIDTGEFNGDGPVPPEMSPSRGKAIDDIPARLDAGEFVFPQDVASWLGEEKMHKIIEKARQDRAELQASTGAVPEVHPADKADAIHREAMPRRQALNYPRG